MRGLRHLAPALLLLLALPACSVVETPRYHRGNKVDADLLKELVVGTSTKADVTSLIGSPTAKATFDDNDWIYISETTRTRVGRTPGILAQNVVVMTFDQGGVLRGIKQLDQDDSRPVDVVSRTTPSPGSEASFMQQLLGNIGKFNTGGAGVGTSSSSAPGSGVGSSGASSNQGL
jgi:outer membrane protein assembly factor BamE (lipoprotein component of BamABCDE complex)